MGKHVPYLDDSLNVKLLKEKYNNDNVRCQYYKIFTLKN